MADRACDVVILGDGPAGALLATRLRDHADVVVVRGARAPDLGIAAVGGVDTPIRLAAALGADAEALWRFSASGLDLPGADPTGSLRIALDPVEAAEWRASLPLLRAWGVEHEVCGDAPFALRFPGDRVWSPPRVEALDGPARCVDGGVALPQGRLRAEIVVVALGVDAAAAHPFFAALVPVRLHRTEVDGQGPPVLFRRRFEALRPGVGFIGCRWAEGPDLGAGVTDAAVSAVVAGAQRDFLAPRGWVAGPVRAGLEAFSCDGLPWIGPLPGDPRIIALTGWDGQVGSWVGAATASVAAALLGGADSLPAPLRARRHA